LILKIKLCIFANEKKIMISKATIDTVLKLLCRGGYWRFCPIEKSWKYFKGLSPFSDERSPSFMVSPAKGIWKDFSSGRGILLPL
jgi:DNA primase